MGYHVEGREASPRPGHPEIVAAIDIGSNSFHLVIAELTDRRIRVLERLRETVRLGAELDNDGNLNTDAMTRALACLEKFSESMARHDITRIRAVATNTLRVAKNREAFVKKGSDRLGCPIEVIDGDEEGRLIYRGVRQCVPESGEAIFVIDIGGGSTELVLGTGALPTEIQSLQLGCVTLQQKYFPNGALSRAAYEQAKKEASDILERARSAFGFIPLSAMGTSGSMQAARDVAKQQFGCDQLNNDAVRQMEDAVCAAAKVSDLSLMGLKEKRRLIFPSGLAIISAALTVFGFQQASVVDSALREGILSDFAAVIQSNS